MHFPVWIHAGPYLVNPHWILEALAYTLGFQLYRWQRRTQGDFLPWLDRIWIIAAAIFGAAIGSKLLYWLEDPAATLAHWNDLVWLLSGKTIIGGLLGGLIAVEWIKKRKGITRRTGDLFAIPICIGIAIGRIGCFLAGLPDQTYGTPTSLPWAIDFGDGIPRHPTQLYESLFAITLAVSLALIHRRRHLSEGTLFRLFLVSYLGFRLIIDFWKPGVPLLGLTSLQWSCAAAVLYYVPGLIQTPNQRKQPTLTPSVRAGLGPQQHKNP